MLRNLGIRSKLLALVAIPMVLLLAVSSVVVVSAVGQASKADRVRQLTATLGMLESVVHGLQAERLATGAHMADPTKKTKTRVEKARQAVDLAVAALRPVAADAPLAEVSVEIEESVESSLGRTELLPGIRQAVDANRADPDRVRAFYDGAIRADIELPAVVAAAAHNEAVAVELRAYAALSAAIEDAAVERDLLGAALAAQRLDGVTFRQLAALAESQDSRLGTFRALASPQQERALDQRSVRAAQRKVEQLRPAAAALRSGKPAGTSVAKWRDVAGEHVDQLYGVEEAAIEGISAVAGEQSGQARQRALFVGLLVGLGLAVALLFVMVISRRMIRPLRELTSAAAALREELPRMVDRMQKPGDGPGAALASIEVDSQDEIGELAEAFNAVNAVTVDVAREQAALRASIAEMFVNVARRNQVLLGRQLAFIDRLEEREEDPDVLENLFRLDHLATRMRRNAESLLVLAGIDGSRRLRTAMPLSDVVRTAASEIESFHRVDLSVAVDPPVTGRVALATAHLVAELLENATNFSNPERRVVVRTGFGRKGVEIVITDQGLGMSDEELAEANTRIANPPVTQIAVAERLGFFVVGRLAQRLGAGVVLAHGISCGTVVTITLPAALFVPGSVPAFERPADDASVSEPAASDEQGQEVEEPRRARLFRRTPRTTQAPAPAVRQPAPAVPAQRTAPVLPEPFPTAAAYGDRTPHFGGAPAPATAAPAVPAVPARPAAPAPVLPSPALPAMGVAAVDILPTRPGRRRKGGPGAQVADPRGLAARVATAFGGEEAPAAEVAAPEETGAGEDFASEAHLASAMLTELSRFSAYSPAESAARQDSGPASGLARRQRRAAEETEQPPPAPAVEAERDRSAEKVRGMLGNFRAGVERGRDQSADTDANSQSA